MVKIPGIVENVADAIGDVTELAQDLVGIDGSDEPSPSGYKTIAELRAQYPELEDLPKDLGLTDELALAKNIVAELEGPDKNWERFIAFLSDRSIITLGGTSGTGTLDSLWESMMGTGSRQHFMEADGAQRIDLGKPEGVMQMSRILSTDVIFEKTFGYTPEDFEKEFYNSEQVKEQMINDYIENLRHNSRFVLATGTVAGMLATTTDEDMSALVEEIEKDPTQFQDFIQITFDGTPQGVIDSLDDLISGMSLAPQEIVKRLGSLDSQEMSLIQSRLQELGYFDTKDGARLMPKFGITSDEATHQAVLNFTHDLLKAKVNNGGDYSVHDFLFEKRLENVARHRQITSDADSEAIRQTRNMMINNAGQIGQQALTVALDESGAVLTERGKELFNSFMSEGFANLSSEDQIALSEAGQAADNERIEQLLATYYSDGTFASDWADSIVVGANSNNDYGHWALMSGHITEEEARILSTPVGKLPADQRARAQQIRSKLEANSVDIARSAMKYHFDMAGYDPNDPSRSKSDTDILRSFNNTFGKATGATNGYDDSRIQALVDSMSSTAGVDWLTAQPVDTTAQDIHSDMAQNAIDALNLPDNQNYDPNMGAAISNVLRSIASTGKVGF
tara:strand:+ start:20607 stop:22475 length:1869 start_codon:yes stop_codon:yes gene_type:complete